MTGLIYVAIIAVWAVVLVPAWLRSHDHLDPQSVAEPLDDVSGPRATRRASTRRAAEPIAHDVAAPVGEAVPDPQRISRADLAAAAGHATIIASRAGSPARPRSAAARRRIVLGALLASLVVVAGLVAAGILLPIAAAAPAALVVTYVGVARHQVRAATRRRSARDLPVDRTATAPVADTRRAATRATGGTWEPRTAPLPTYVTAPPAAGFPRVIDTETPGAWTAAAMLERAQQEKLRAERMAAAKAEAIARAKAEQAAAEARSRDEEFLAQQSSRWDTRPSAPSPYRRRAVNE